MLRLLSHLQDEEAKEWCEVQLAEQGGQDAAVDLEVGLSDLWASSRVFGGGGRMAVAVPFSLTPSCVIQEVLRPVARRQVLRQAML